MSLIRSPTITVQIGTPEEPPSQPRTSMALNALYRAAIKFNRTALQERLENFAARYYIRLEA